MIKVFYNVLGVILAIIGVVLLYYSTNFLIQYYSIDCVVAPNDYVISNENVLDANEFGDYFGGIMNPLIGLTAAFITFLAFFIQFLANRQITSQFQIQQFESQFYEMLKLHKENVNEIEITVKNTVVNNTGNKEIILSGTTAKYFKHDLKFIKSSQDSYKTLRGRDVFRVMKNEFEIYLSEAKTLKGNCLEGEDFEAVYELFFLGCPKLR